MQKSIKCLLPFVCLLFLKPDEVAGQKTRTIELEMSSGGRIARLESRKIEPEDSIRFLINSPESIRKALEEKKKFIEAIKDMGNIELEQELKRRADSIFKLITNSKSEVDKIDPKDKDFLIQVISPFELTNKSKKSINLYNYLESLRKQYLSDTSNNSSPASNGKNSCTTCKIDQTKDLIREFLETLKELISFRQQRILLKELLCVYDAKWLDSVYGGLFPEYSVGGGKAVYNKDSNYYSAIIKAASLSEGASVIRIDRFKEGLTKIHNEHQTLIQNEHIDILNKMIDSSKKIINVRIININNSLFESADSDKENPPTNQKENSDKDRKYTIDSLLGVFREVSRYDSIWCEGSAIFEWLRAWAPFSNGGFSLNYLPYRGAIPEKDTITRINNERQNLIELFNEIERQKKNCLDCELSDLDTLKLLQKKAESIRQRLKEVDILISEYQKNQKYQKEFQTTKTVIHSLRLPPCCGTRWYQFHDASNNFILCQESTPILPEYTPVFIGVYNDTVPENRGVALKQTIEEFKDKGAFVQDLSSAMSELGEAVALLAPAYTRIKPFLERLFVPPFVYGGTNGIFPNQTNNKKVDETHIKKLADLTYPVWNKNNSTILDNVKSIAIKYSINQNELLYEAIQQKYWRLMLLDRMISDYMLNPTPGRIEPSVDAPTNYYTYAVKPNVPKAPYTNRYEFIKGEKTLSTNRYSVGSLRRFTVGTGFLFNTNVARQVYVDSAGGTIKITNSSTPAKFVVGLKYFPWKSFMADDGFVPQRGYIKHRLSFFTGFEVTRPLDNLYAGFGYDILPGLHVSGGLHIYKQDVFKVSNNQIADQRAVYKTSGPYWGITLDPIVMAGLIKLFFK